MRRRIASTLCAAMALMVMDGRALAQSEEWDLDGESGAEQSAEEEMLERLRRSPIDLRSASEDDLLQIPGLRRREASAIVRAVRDGTVVEIHSIDLVPGVRRGTAERISPYVVLSGEKPFADFKTRFRSIASWKGKDGHVELVRRQYDLRIDGSRDAKFREPLRLEFRQNGAQPSGWFSYARIPGPLSGWSLAFGDLDVRSGSALLDRGRRTALQRPFDWERRLSSDARILPGYDAGIAERAAAFQATADERVVQASLSTDKSGRRSGMISWTERWPNRLTTHFVRDLRTAGTSIRMEYDARFARLSVEGGYAARVASYVASFRWQDRGSTWVHGVGRMLRRIAAPGVPRVGNRSTDEIGVSVAMQHIVSRRLGWHVAGDLGRVDEGERGPRMIWPSFTLGMGCTVRWENRSNVGAEWKRSERDRERTEQWSLRLNQRLSERVIGALVLSHRAALSGIRAPAAGALAMSTLSWVQSDFSAHIRWTAGDGDPSTEFWSLGPGHSVLNGLQRFAGRMGEVRGVVQWRPTRSAELAIAAARRVHPTEELRSSILLEIHL